MPVEASTAPDTSPRRFGLQSRNETGATGLTLFVTKWELAKARDGWDRERGGFLVPCIAACH